LNAQPRVLRLGEDAELDRIQTILEGLDAEVDRQSVDDVPADVGHGYDLVVAGADAVAEISDPVCTGDRRSIWIAVHDDAPARFREHLQSLGFHYLIHSNLDSEVLRLLFLHALYEGPERRGVARTPVGSTISVKTDHDCWPATLFDVTRDGCRLWSTHMLEPGVTISVIAPAGLVGESEFTLPGRVVRFERDDADGDKSHRIAIRFDDVDASAAAALDAILAGEAPGAAVTTLRGSGEILLEDLDRRGQDRIPFERRITAMLGEASHVMLGRDLSVSGMRIEPRRELEKGAELKLAIYAGKTQEPVFVDAVVCRNDGARGIALRFTSVDAVMRDRLEQIVSASPAIEDLGGDADTNGIVISKTVRLESEA
jgi:hypothetical protein